MATDPPVAYRGPVSSPVASPGTAPVPAARPAADPADVGRSGVAHGLTTAACAATGIWLLWRLFVDTAGGQRVDQAVFEGAAYGRTRLWQVAQPVLDLISVPFLALVLLGTVLIAIGRRRWGLAVQVALLVGGANLTTQVLKNIVFERPDLGATSAGYANTLPSGHTTVAASVSAALVFVVPPRARPWAAVLGALYTAATGVSTLIGRWHRPSDVAAAVLVVLAWSGFACALAAATRPRDGVGRPLLPGRGSGGRRARPGGFGVGGGLLLLAGSGAAVPAGYAMHRSWTTTGALDSRAELLLAYAGGALGVVAISAVAFAALLLVCRATGRAA